MENPRKGFKVETLPLCSFALKYSLCSLICIDIWVVLKSCQHHCQRQFHTVRLHQQDVNNEIMKSTLIQKFLSRVSSLIFFSTSQWKKNVCRLKKNPTVTVALKQKCLGYDISSIASLTRLLCWTPIPKNVLNWIFSVIKSMTNSCEIGIEMEQKLSSSIEPRI